MSFLVVGGEEVDRGKYFCFTEGNGGLTHRGFL